jgi:hypothetical protein
MTKSPVIGYFGKDTVKRAIASYFAKHGVTEDVRDYLMVLEDEKPDDFFQLVSDFIEK